MNLAVLVHGLKFMTSSQQSSSCFLGSSTWMNGSSDGPSVPCCHLTPTSWSATSYSFCFHFCSLCSVDLYSFCSQRCGIFTDFPSKTGKPTGKRHQPSVVCDPPTCQAHRAPHESRMNKPRRVSAWRAFGDPKKWGLVGGGASKCELRIYTLWFMR